MYSQNELDEAVAAGALAPDQASSLRAFVASRNATPTADEEYLHVFRGYNDVFASYACLLALVVAGWLGTLIPLGGDGPALGPIPNLPFMAPLLVAAASWGLAELFVARRGTALPAILLPMTFGFGIFIMLVFLMVRLASDPIGASILAALCAAVAAGATWGFWLRFRTPLAPALAVGFGVLAIAALLLGLLATSPSAFDVLNIVVLLCGLGVFAYAMTLDGGDPWRVSRRSEVGLWMHGLAGGLIVYPLVYFLGLGDGVASVGGAIAAIVLFLILAALALAVNRKLYVVAGLSPLLVALNRLINGEPATYRSPYNSYGEGFGGAFGGNPYASPYGMGPGRGMTPDLLNGTFTTLLVVSLILLGLAIWWSPLRRLVHGLSPQGLRNRVPYVAAARPIAPPPAPPSY